MKYDSRGFCVRESQFSRYCHALFSVCPEKLVKRKFLDAHSDSLTADRQATRVQSYISTSIPQEISGLIAEKFKIHRVASTKLAQPHSVHEHYGSSRMHLLWSSYRVFTPSKRRWERIKTALSQQSKCLLGMTGNVHGYSTNSSGGSNVQHFYETWVFKVTRSDNSRRYLAQLFHLSLWSW